MEIFSHIVQFKNYQRKIINQNNKENYFENGRIVLKKHTINLITIEEHGQFVKGRYTNKTLNYYQWQFINKHQLQLSHLRNTEQNAEQLVTFNVPSSNFDCITSTPYFCGQDCYQANLNFTNNKFMLTWLVNGPKKDLLIESTYFIK